MSPNSINGRHTLLISFAKIREGEIEMGKEREREPFYIDGKGIFFPNLNSFTPVLESFGYFVFFFLSVVYYTCWVLEDVLL